MNFKLMVKICLKNTFIKIKKKIDNFFFKTFDMVSHLKLIQKLKDNC